MASSISSIIQYLKEKFQLQNEPALLEDGIERVRSGAEISHENLWVLGAAIFIASLGLNTNSTAVIIGAMLISPLMGPIIGVGMGLAIEDDALVWRALRNLGVSVAVSLVVSTLYFWLSPIDHAGSELIARTSPNIYDVAIAFVGGLAGIIAVSSSLRDSNVIPGVAIATALMPPLCTVGFGLATANFSYALGAFYLFFINSVFICTATFLIARWMQYPRLQKAQGQYKRARWLSILAIITIVPSIIMTWNLVKQSLFQKRAKAYIEANFNQPGIILARQEVTYKSKKPVIKLLLLGEGFNTVQLEQWRGALKQYRLEEVDLQVLQGNKSKRLDEWTTSVDGMQAANQAAIEQLISKTNSLDSLIKAVRPMPIVQQIVSGWPAQYNAVQQAVIQPSYIYTQSLNKVDTLWSINVVFKPNTNRAELLALKKSLQEQLQTYQIQWSWK